MVENRSMKRTYLNVALTVIAFILAVWTLSHFSTNANANNADYCDQGQHIGNPHCQPTPTIKPTATPTPTKTPHCWEDCYKPTPTPTPKCGWNVDHPCTTPTPTVTPTPTQPCLQEGDEDVQVPCPTPTATPTPSQQNTPSGGSSSGGSGGNNPPPVASCGSSFPAPVIVSFTSKGDGTVNFGWTAVQTYDKYSITFGTSPDNLNMGEDNIPGNVTNWDIHDLPVGSHVWAQLQAWQNGCEESSNIFDPLVL